MQKSRTGRVCLPGRNNWSRIFPNFSAAVGNINNFVRDGKRLGAIGMLNTDWKDDGEALFNAIRKLDQINNLLRSAGVGDANDEMFWFDPFSATGAERVRKASGVAAQVRRLAEDAWVDLAAHSGEALVHRDTLPFLRFAAKRLDCMGMKLQYSREIANSYRERNTYAAGQRVQDLRDYVNELRAGYRALWLAENRPHWIDNVLVRYDNEALYWVPAPPRCLRSGRQGSLPFLRGFCAFEGPFIARLLQERAHVADGSRTLPCVPLRPWCRSMHQSRARTHPPRKPPWLEHTQWHRWRVR